MKGRGEMREFNESSKQLEMWILTYKPSSFILLFPLKFYVFLLKVTSSSTSERMQMGKSVLQYRKRVKDGACLPVFKVSRRKRASDRFPLSVQCGFGYYSKIQERRFWRLSLISIPASNEVLV